MAENKLKMVKFTGTLEGGNEVIELPEFSSHMLLGKTDNMVANFGFQYKGAITVSFSQVLEKEVNWVKSTVLDINGKQYKVTFVCGYKLGIKHTRFGDKQGMIKTCNGVCFVGEMKDNKIVKYLATYVNAGACIALIRLLQRGVDSAGYRKADNIYKALTLREDRHKTTATNIVNFDIKTIQL